MINLNGPPDLISQFVDDCRETGYRVTQPLSPSNYQIYHGRFNIATVGIKDDGTPYFGLSDLQEIVPQRRIEIEHYQRQVGDMARARRLI